VKSLAQARESVDVVQEPIKMSKNGISEKGYSIYPHVFSPEDISEFFVSLNSAHILRSRAGIRHALRHPCVAELANRKQLLDIARTILGETTSPFRATLFDKSQASNWLVVWHQDTALPLQERREVAGWGPWSVKDAVTYAHAPAATLSKVVALRVHLDDSTAQNGPLRVLPGTHTQGVLSDDAIHQLASKISPVECIIPAGGILAMRPLLVHSSSKSIATIPRRVLHIEFIASRSVGDGLELAIA
jgi:ectoine hydroxylase-related dioxygenase (phytanoyl-CoA dioxygenase family)